MVDKKPDQQAGTSESKKSPIPKKPKGTTNTPKPAAGLQFCPFKRLINLYIDSCRANGLSPKTIHDYYDKLIRFRWWWVEHTHYGETLGAHPKFVTVKEAREFSNYLREPTDTRWGNPAIKTELTNASISTYGRTIKVFFHWLESEEHIDYSPFTKGVKFVSNQKQDKTIKNLNADQLATIFEALTKPDRIATFTGCRDLAVISLLLDSGMRRGELLSMTFRDLDMKRMRCTIRGKSGQRYAMFSEGCQAALAEYLSYLKDYGPEEPLWINDMGEPLTEDGFMSMVKRLNRISGVKFHVHQLRHTFATMMSSKISAFDLRDLLGHSNISTTMIYVQRDPDRLAEIHQASSPLTILGGGMPSIKRRGRPRKH